MRSNISCLLHAGAHLEHGAGMVSWSVVHNNGELLDVLSKLDNQKKAFKKFVGFKVEGAFWSM